MPTLEIHPTDHPLTSGNEHLQTMREIGQTLRGLRLKYEERNNANLISLTGRKVRFFHNVEIGATDKFDFFSYLGILRQYEAISEISAETIEQTLQRIRF